jgi:hypothetical protein
MPPVLLNGLPAEAKRIYGDTIPSPYNDARIVVTKQPIGGGSDYPREFPMMITAKLRQHLPQVVHVLR